MSCGVVTEVPRQSRLLAQVWHENAPSAGPGGRQKHQTDLGGESLDLLGSSRRRLESHQCPGRVAGMGGKNQVLAQNTDLFTVPWCWFRKTGVPNRPARPLRWQQRGRRFAVPRQPNTRNRMRWAGRNGTTSGRRGRFASLSLTKFRAWNFETLNRGWHPPATFHGEEWRTSAQ